MQIAGKFRRTIIADVRFQQIFVHQIVIDTSEERDQITFCLENIRSRVISVQVIVCVLCGTMEMLPRVTSHDIKMMLFIEILSVLQIKIQ